MQPDLVSSITPMPTEPTRITVEQYLDLARSGRLGEDDRVELLEGVIVAMTPIGLRHAAAVAYLMRFFIRALDDRARVWVQSPFRAGEWSLPEPDLAVIPGDPSTPLSDYPERALLLVEVADSTLHTDRLSKAAIYAAANVSEYWVVDLRSDVVEVFRAPDRKTARWREHVTAAPGERVVMAAVPDCTLDVAELIRAAGPAQGA